MVTSKASYKGHATLMRDDRVGESRQQMREKGRESSEPKVPKVGKVCRESGEVKDGCLARN